MKFFTPTYVSPNKQQGTFTDVYVEDCGIIHNRDDRNLTVIFKMYYFDEDGTTKIEIHRTMMTFSDGNVSSPQGSFLMPMPGMMMNNYGNTNRTIFARVENPDYNPEEPTSQSTMIVPALPLIIANGGTLPEGITITDWGFPNYTDVLGYVNGGDLTSPEMHISNPLAVGFMTNTLGFEYGGGVKKSISDLGFNLVTQ